MNKNNYCPIEEVREFTFDYVGISLIPVCGTNANAQNSN